MRTILLVAAWCTTLLGSCYILLVLTGKAPVCEDEQRLRVNVSSFDFEFIDTFCGGFGSSEALSVLGRKKGDWNWTLLFKYDPVYISYRPTNQIELPTISIPEANRMIITVSRVRFIYSQRYEWRGMRIEYEVGKIHNSGGDQPRD